MKNIIIAILTSLLLFAGSAGMSFYLNQPVPEEATGELPVDDAEMPPEELPEATEKAAQMPVAIRPDQEMTIDAVLQMTESARRRKQKLDDYHEQLKAEEKRIGLLFEDLKREKNELQTFSEGVESKVAALDEMTVQLADQLARLEQRSAELKKLEEKVGVEADKSEEIDSRVKQIKGWFSSLEAKQAADILIEKANSGDLEFAASLLHSLPDRQKAKILPAINDPVLVTQLIDSLKLKKKKEK